MKLGNCSVYQRDMQILFWDSVRKLTDAILSLQLSLYQSSQFQGKKNLPVFLKLRTRVA